MLSSRIVFVVPLAALAVGCLSQAGPPVRDEAVPLTAFVGKPGDRVKVTRELTNTNASEFLLNGEPLKRVEKSEVTAVTVTEVLAVGPDGAPSKLKRTFEKAEKKSNEKTTPQPLSGKTVLIEKTGDTFTFTYAGGGAVTGRELSEFTGEFTANPPVDDFRSYLPDGPPQPGGTWDLKDRMLRGGFKPFDMVGEKTTAGGKLVKVYAKGGATFGVFEVRAEGPFTGLRGNGAGFAPGCTIVLEHKADGCIDGTRPDRTTTNAMKIRTNFPNGTALTETTTRRKVELLPRP